jgi:hypothetical protein
MRLGRVEVPMPNDEAVRIPRWLLILVLGIIMSAFGKLAVMIWESDLEFDKETRRLVDTLAREFTED